MVSISSQCFDAVGWAAGSGQNRGSDTLFPNDFGEDLLYLVLHKVLQYFFHKVLQYILLTALHSISYCIAERNRAT